jgi:nucleotide-binding universal stress UspA family protein
VNASEPPSEPASRIRTVIVPLDGSATAESALRPAIQIADRAEAKLVLLTTRWELTSIDTVHRYLDARIAFLEHDAEPLVILDRDAPDAILLASEEPDTLVCMTTRGRGAVSEAVLGSVAAEVVRGCRSPVVLVGPHARPDWALPDTPLVLAGFDGSDHSRAGIRSAGRLAAALGGRVRVVEVARLADVIAVPRHSMDHVDDLEALVAELRSAIRVPADYEVVDGDDMADRLIAEVVERGAALLALGTHGRTGFRRAVLGSVTTRAFRHAPVPVLVTGPAHGGAA